MDKRLLCVLLFVCVLITNLSAQEASAIDWATGLTWQQVKAKAKKANKFIFVDCYTTWCKPCREMDQKVYTVDSVGKYLNAHFITVKVQMDKTNNDDAFVKKWYKTATQMAKKYNVDAYPTMLFFTPSGEVATKHIGFMAPAAFIRAAGDAKDPAKQYYVLLKNYRKKKLDDATKKSLIKTAKQLNDTTNYRALRDDYFAYLHQLPKEQLYTKENIEFIAATISRRTQVVFDMFYPDANYVDKVMEKKGYARKVVDEVIMKEKVSPVFNSALEANVEPDWDMISESIAKDFKGDYADRAVTDAKIRWYWQTGGMRKFAVTLNDKMEKYGSDTTNMGQDFILNNMANKIWEVIGAVATPGKGDIQELIRTSNWMEDVVRRGDNPANGFYYTEHWHAYIDTYANLLHKIGRTPEAIKYEELAISKCKELAEDKGYIELYQYNLAKMKNGEPTWPINAN